VIAAMGTQRRRLRAAAGLAVGLVALSVVAAPFPASATDASPGASPASSGAPTGTAVPAPIGGPRLTGKGVVVTYGPDAAPLPKIAAKSWVLADLTTGQILAAKAPHLARPPASTLKTLTALTLIPQLDPKKVYRSTESDITVEGSRAGLVDHATYTVDDLFYAMLLPSGNDAARALAHANGGVSKTVAEMNEQARHLQALDTLARTPHGLDTPGQVSSAYDLALFARSAMQLPDFRTYVSTLRYDFPGKMPKAGKKRKTFELWNQNPLLREGYRGVLGVKTGYTTLAGRTFVGAAKRGDHTLVVTLMGITEPSVDAASKLLTWGFHEEAHVTPVGALVEPVSDTAPPGAAPSQPLTAAAPFGSGPVTATSATTGTSASWPVARWLGGALIVAGAVVGLLALRGRRRDERSRQRLMAAARRAR
jgi:serine-type D-Ala-D-Ala carboxypeptidase (penicillin-binding protein 5/6)